MAKKFEPSSPLDDLKLWNILPEAELKWNLETYYDRYQKDTSHCLVPLLALKQIGAYYWTRGEPDASAEVPVPWWIIDALTEALQIYENSQGSTTSLTLGEAFKIEGKGQGKRRKIDELRAIIRNARICIRIALAEANGEKIAAVIQELASASGLSCRTIEGIWQGNREHAHLKAAQLPVLVPGSDTK